MPDTNTEQQSPSAFAPTGERSLAIRQAAQIVTGDRGLKLTNYEEMYRFAKAVALSKFNPYPNDWTDVDCFICLQKGAEVGMSPMQSLESIYVVNNRATIFGDAPKGLVEASGLMIDYDQYEEGKPFEDDYKWIVSSHRRGRSKPLITTYSVADAKTAGLWDKRGVGGKPSAWVTAPKRMLMFRARGFNLRDNFPDVLRGFTIGELVDDESVAGFEHAKVASAKLVEPRFESAPGQAAPPEPAAEAEAPRRRGRPPKSEAPKPPETVSAPVPETVSAPVPETVSTPQADPAPAPEPSTAPPNVPETSQGTLFGAQTQAIDLAGLEIRHRLKSAKISEEIFLKLLLEYGYINCDPTEIVMGSFGIEKVEKKDLELVVRNWPQVLEQLNKRSSARNESGN